MIDSCFQFCFSRNPLLIHMIIMTEVLRWLYHTLGRERKRSSKELKRQFLSHWDSFRNYQTQSNGDFMQKFLVCKCSLPVKSSVSLTSCLAFSGIWRSRTGRPPAESALQGPQTPSFTRRRKSDPTWKFLRFLKDKSVVKSCLFSQSSKGEGSGQTIRPVIFSFWQLPLRSRVEKSQE